MPASMARDRNVLSTPYITSASGASLARMALLTISPASPDRRMFSETLFCCSKAALTASDMANASCVMTVSWPTAGDGELVAGGLPAGEGDGLVVVLEPAVTTKASATKRRFLGTPDGYGLRRADHARRQRTPLRRSAHSTDQALALVEALRP